MSNTRQPSLVNIQLARGIAAILVVAAHANLGAPAAFNGFFIPGWCGVDFFFVLSGFIIFYSSAKHLGHSEYLSSYFAKRFMRVFPIYWLYTGGAVLLLIALREIGFTVYQWVDLSPTGLIKTIVLWPSDVHSEIMPILPVAWTLSYEIAFYALFGVAIAFGKRVALLSATVWVVAILAIGAQYTLPSGTLTKLLLDPRNIEFIFGCFAGYCAPKIASLDSGGKIAPNLFAAGSVLLAFSWASAVAGYASSKFDAAVFGIPFFLIVLSLAVIDLRGQRSANAWTKAGVFFGNASYSIYLIHFIPVALIAAAGTKFGLNPYATFISASGIGLVLGCVGFVKLELPLTRLLSMRHLNPTISTRSNPAQINMKA